MPWLIRAGSQSGARPRSSNSATAFAYWKCSIQPTPRVSPRWRWPSRRYSPAVERGTRSTRRRPPPRRERQQARPSPRVAAGAKRSVLYSFRFQCVCTVHGEVRPHLGFADVLPRPADRHLVHLPRRRAQPTVTRTRSGSGTAHPGHIAAERLPACLDRHLHRSRWGSSACRRLRAPSGPTCYRGSCRSAAAAPGRCSRPTRRPGRRRRRSRRTRSPGRRAA